MEALEKLTAEKPKAEAAEIFDPQAELGRVKQLPKEERSEALREYKENLAWKKEGNAKMQAAFIEIIRNNPDISLEELDQRAEDFGKELKLSPHQKVVTRTVLEIYVKKHQAIKKIREKYPDDADLFQALFGQKPEGFVEILHGPITLFVRCHNVKDFALIQTQAFKTKKVISREELAMASIMGGISVYPSLIPGLEGVITAENTQGRKFDKGGATIFKHEEQHALNRWFEKETERQTYVGELEKAKSDGEREFSLKGLLRVIRESKLESAKNELLAYFKEGRGGVAIFDTLTTPTEKGGLYDYFAGAKKFWRDYFLNILGREHEKLIERSIKAVFELEYHDLLRGGIAAFVILKSNGFSTDQAIGFLIGEPLEKWPKVVRRILEKRISARKNDNN